MALDKHGNHGSPATAPTARDLVAFLFRQRRAAIISFVVIFVLVAAFTLLKSDRYAAHMLILVESGERANTAVSAGPNVPPAAAPTVSQAEMNSELALLESQDVLQQVVETCHLDRYQPSFLHRVFGGATPSRGQRITRATRTLAHHLNIEIPTQSNIISVSYSSTDPRLAARVLNVLGADYLKMDAALHRPSGAEEFFRQQESRYGQDLALAQARLIRFTRDRGVVSAPVQMAAALRHLEQFEQMNTETQVETAQTKQRIAALESEKAQASPRMTTAVTTAENPQLIGGLETTLLTQELKRTDLLAKFSPTYRLVVELDAEIAQTKAALAQALGSPAKAETTDSDPNYVLVREDLSKAQADLAGLQARTVALHRAVHKYQSQAAWIEQQGVEQQNLMRQMTTDETNYQLFASKYEDARVSEALDSHRILNVKVAEAAMAPTLPVHSRSWYLLVAAVIAFLGAVAMAVVTDNLDPTFRNPDDIESSLGLAVVAVMPKRPNGGKARGNETPDEAGGIKRHVS